MCVCMYVSVDDTQCMYAYVRICKHIPCCHYLPHSPHHLTHLPLFLFTLPLSLCTSLPLHTATPLPLPYLTPFIPPTPPFLPLFPSSLSPLHPFLPPCLTPTLPLSLPPLSALTALSSSLVPNGADCQVIYLNRPPGKSLGFSIVGGRRSPKGDCPVYIKSLAPKSIAESDGRLHCGDELVAVNNIPLRDFSQQEVVKLIRDLSGPVSLTIRISEDSSDR